MKAKIWGSCGSLPSPSTSSDIEAKITEALKRSRGHDLSSENAIQEFVQQLPRSLRGTYRANTSCVQIDANTDSVILCDAGTGIRDYALTLDNPCSGKTFHIFLSHLHWDHIQGFPFFTPAYQAGNKIIFHSFHKETEAAIRMQMQSPCFPVPFDAMLADIEFDIQENGHEFQIEDVTIKTIKQVHPGDSWGFRFEKNNQSIVYSTDSEHSPDTVQEQGQPFIDFFKDTDILIIDGQYTQEQVLNEKRNWGHSDHTTAVELATRSGAKRLIIFHHEPAYSDSVIEEIHAAALKQVQEVQAQSLGTAPEQDSMPQRVELAYDGLTAEA